MTLLKPMYEKITVLVIKHIKIQLTRLYRSLMNEKRVDERDVLMNELMNEQNRGREFAAKMNENEMSDCKNLD